MVQPSENLRPASLQELATSHLAALYKPERQEDQRHDKPQVSLAESTLIFCALAWVAGIAGARHPPPPLIGPLRGWSASTPSSAAFIRPLIHPGALRLAGSVHRLPTAFAHAWR